MTSREPGRKPILAKLLDRPMMPRYFFNIRNHDSDNIVDDEGIDLPDLEAAKVEAQNDIIDLLNSRSIALGNHWPQWSIDICDSRGNVLLVVPFSNN